MLSNDRAILVRRIFYSILVVFLVSLSVAVANAQGLQTPKVEIVNATFGEGRGTAHCTQRIRDIIKKTTASKTISTPGLRLKNPRGTHRRELRINYRVDGQEGLLILKNGQKVNIYKAIIDHARSNKATIPSTPTKKTPTKKTPTKKTPAKKTPAKRPPSKKQSKDQPAKELSKPPAMVQSPKKTEPPMNATLGGDGPGQREETSIATAFKLPGKVDVVRAGGAGRYLIFHIREKGILAVFDVVNRKIVKEITVPGNCAFAANREKLVIALPRARQLQLWDLRELRREKVARFGRDLSLKFAVMGEAGDGPILLSNGKGAFELWDVPELKRIPIEEGTFGNGGDYAFETTVSADGRTFCGWTSGLSAQAFQLLRVVNGDYRVVTTGRMMERSRVRAEPSADGGALILAGRTMLGYDLKPIPIPGFDGKEIFSEADSRFLIAVGKNDKQTVDITICTAADFHPVQSLTIDAVGDLVSQAGWSRVGDEPRFRYLPDENLITYLNAELDHVVIREFDLKTELDRSGRPYLFVKSKPRPVAKMGETYSYQLEAVSNSGNVVYSLDSGPKGMTVSQSGLVNWPITSNPDEGIASVIIQATDSGGEQFVHVFEVVVDNARRTVMAGDSGKGAKGGGSSGSTLGLASSGAEMAFEFEEEFDTVRTGGAGRYLVFHLRKKGVLAVFDAVKRSVVKEIPVPGGVVYAANRTHLVIVFPREQQMQRWSLEGLRREKTVKLSRNIPAKKALMGSNGEGPLLLSNGENVFQFWDVEEMKPIEFKGEMLVGHKNFQFELTVSANGKAFCGWASGISGQEFQLLRVENGALSVRRTLKAYGMNGRWAMPSTEGDKMFIFDGTVHSYDLKPLQLPELKGASVFPTSDPRYILEVRPSESEDTQLTIRTAADFRPVIALPPIKEVRQNSRRVGWLGFEWGRLGDEARYRFLPSENLIIVLAGDNKRVIVRSLDLEKELKEGGGKYLIVTSKPKSLAFVGSEFEYQLEALSSSDKIQFQLQTGPKGLSLGDSGRLNWPITYRPLGGVANVVVLAKDGDGNQFTHAFEITIERRVELAGSGNRGRDGALDGNGSEVVSGGFVEVDELRLELPQLPNSITPGLDGRTLVLAGEELAILGSDGWTVEQTARLDRVYKDIYEREDYFVAIEETPSGVYIINKKTFKVIRSVKLDFYKTLDVAPHPTLPISYITGKMDIDVPRYKFIIFNEKTGDARGKKDWIGNWIRIDPGGEFLISAFSDFYVKGSRLVMNPQHWHVTPEYGSLDWLIRFKLDRNGNPESVEAKESAGGNCYGIRMSPDGKRVTYLSHVGYPKFSKNQAAWDSRDLTKIPVRYETKDRAETTDLAYHPGLPLVAAPGSGSAVFFDRETGEFEPDRLGGKVEELVGLKTSKIFFSPDGKNLILVADIGGIHYLHKLPLVLNSKEIRIVESGVVKSGMTKKTAPKSVTVPLSELDALNGGAGNEMTTAEIAKAYMESVVVIRSGNASGTGFVVGKKGYVLTCAHCVPDEDLIQVTLGGSGRSPVTSEAIVIAIDDDLDLALLKVKRSHRFKSVRLAIGHGLETGVPVSVIGHPGAGSTSLDYTMTEGIVSNPNRMIEAMTYIQSSAAINPGSSGGPMFDEQGFVIGMVVLKARIEGAGFAIPSDRLGEFMMSQLRPSQDAMAIERVWMDADSKRPLIASLLEFSSKQIRVKRISDGREFTVPLKNLSEPDRKFVRMLTTQVRLNKKK